MSTDFEEIRSAFPEFNKENLKLDGVVGSGANNKVIKATWKGKECVLRMPRRRSDTQQRGNAKWEYIHTVAAAELGVAPRVFDACYARHAKDRNWPSGLYMVQEYFHDDLASVSNDPEKRECYSGAGDGIVSCIASLARAGMFMYDFKPSNVVVRKCDDDTVEARIIDYGRDFCEWEECSEDADHNAPHLAMLERLLAPLHPDPKERRMARALILFAVMLVQLSAVTTRHLHSDRHEHRMNASERENAHPVRAHAVAVLDEMQGRHKRVVRELLRSDPVRSVLRHYNSRQRSGTGRTLRLARGIEV